MVKISQAEINILNNDFYAFKTRITQSKKRDTSYFVSQMNHFERKYKQAGLERSFAGNIFTFAEQMRKLGFEDFPGIIYSNLMKMPFLKPHVRELYATKALEYAQEQGDTIHELARLVDLEKMYKASKETKKYAKVLFMQEKALIRICDDFKSAKKNYKTYSRESNTLQKYELELAKTRVDIAKVVLRVNPKLARNVLIKARGVFERENRIKEVDFVDLLLSQIQST